MGVSTPREAKETLKNRRERKKARQATRKSKEKMNTEEKA